MTDRKAGKLGLSCEEVQVLACLSTETESPLTVAGFPQPPNCVPQPKLNKHSARLIPHHSIALGLRPQGLWDAEAKGIILSDFRLYCKATVNKAAKVLAPK